MVGIKELYSCKLKSQFTSDRTHNAVNNFQSCFSYKRYKSGLIAVLNVNANDGRISMVNKLQGHSSEIHSLAWCPTPNDHIEFGKCE